jgi:outer membrane immunogenic protein
MQKFPRMLASAAILAAAESASAADMSFQNRPIMPAAPAFSWTGCYAGTQSALGTGHAKWQDVDTPGDIDGNFGGNTANTDMSGALWGGQLGCDYQGGQWFLGGSWVLGMQGMLVGSTVTGTNQDQFNATWALRDRIDRVSSVTGRLGTTIADRTLVYLRCGVAWAHNKFEIENTGFNLGVPTNTAMGWTIGTGIEYALTPSWSVFLETSYYDFGSHNVGFIGSPATANLPFTVKTSQTMETFQVGANYRFWGGRY